MRTLLIVVSVCFLRCICCLSQYTPVYDYTLKNEGAYLTGATVAWLGSNYLKSKAAKADPNDLFRLNSSDVWAFDRIAIGNNSPSAKSLSDKFLYSSLALPFLSYIDPVVRKEKAAVAFMAIEAILINDAITNIFKSSVGRHRPYLYSEVALPEAGGITSSSRESFISGHTSNVATASFLTAQILTDLHPDSKLKPLIWTTAALAPAITGYLRVKAGRHFPTDVIAGYGVGALIGTFIPKLHRMKIAEDTVLNLGSVSDGVGARLTINLD